MEKIKKSQHRLILTQLYNNLNNVNIKLLLKDQDCISGTLLNMEDDAIDIKTCSRTKNINFRSIDEVFILN